MQGNEVLMNSSLYNLLISLGYNLSNNQNSTNTPIKLSNNTISSPRINTIKPSITGTTVKLSKPSWVMPVLIVVGLFTFGFIVYKISKNKK